MRLLTFPRLVIAIPLLALLISLIVLYYTNPPKPTPGSCKILEQKFCSQGKLIRDKTPQGQEVKYIAFDLPAGTPIYSPIDGQANKAKITQPSPFIGYYVSIASPNDPNRTGYNFRGDIELSNPNFVDVGKGVAFGTIGNSGSKEFGNYNLIFNIVSIDQATRQSVLNEELIKKLFPTKL